LIDQDCGVSLERPRTSAETEKRLLAQLQDSGGRDVRVLWDLGVFYSQAGCHDQATACIQRVVELIEDPEKQAACFLALGQIEEQKRDYRSAATRYRSGIGLEPRDQRTAYFLRNNLGFFVTPRDWKSKASGRVVYRCHPIERRGPTFSTPSRIPSRGKPLPARRRARPTTGH
jgi:tetratricopeptide (TPR) repeat protein